MPKLDDTHRSGRISERIKQLEDGHELEARDFEKLLDAEQLREYKDAWAAQQTLRKNHSPKTDAEKIAIGWKNKREIRLNAYLKALADLQENMVDTFKKLQRDAEIRQARIYFEAYGTAIDAGKTNAEAKAWANNELVRAGLKRLHKLE